MIRVGLVSSAHLHVGSYARVLNQMSDRVQVVGGWDDELARMVQLCATYGWNTFATLDELLAASDAVVICSENLKHADHIEAAVAAGCHVLCEKPIVGSEADAARIKALLPGLKTTLMTAFPCPFSPVFADLKARVQRGEVGQVLALATTNRGTCPGGWFTDPSLSGGGAMIDHTVHVTDLLRRLLGAEPVRVQAQTGNNRFQGEFDDTAMVTIEFPGGIFATLDSSWSRPAGYKTWGDVTLRVVGDQGIAEADLFGYGMEVYPTDASGLHMNGIGADLDRLMVEEFLNAIAEGREPLTSAQDGLAASAVALAAYRSLGQPVPAPVV
jgi:predicted dehydrogenase